MRRVLAEQCMRGALGVRKDSKSFESVTGSGSGLPRRPFADLRWTAEALARRVERIPRRRFHASVLLPWPRSLSYPACSPRATLRLLRPRRLQTGWRAGRDGGVAPTLPRHLRQRSGEGVRTHHRRLEATAEAAEIARSGTSAGEAM